MTKSAPIEIERKFLVSSLPRLHDLEAVHVRQGYLTSVMDSVEIRLRQSDKDCFMTLKSGDGLKRVEYEIGIVNDQFDALWPATAGRRIEKTRYVGFLADQRIFELDVFLGHLSSLVLVEVEFDSVKAARDFIPPAWFGIDVTDDGHFKNKSLATRGLPAVLH